MAKSGYLGKMLRIDRNDLFFVKLMILNEILYQMDQLLAVYLTEGILYVNNHRLFDITRSLLVIYFPFYFYLLREQCI